MSSLLRQRVKYKCSVCGMVREVGLCGTINPNALNKCPRCDGTYRIDVTLPPTPGSNLIG